MPTSNKTLSDFKKSRSSSLVQPNLISLRKVSTLGDRLSEVSFKQWHLKMQNEHELLVSQGKVKRLCKPFRWMDSVEYDKKICKCCFKYKTCKTISFILLIGFFAFLFMYSLLQDELLPGGTFFFAFLLIFLAYVAGFITMFAGLPPLFGNLLVGVVAGNMPVSWLPNYDSHILERITSIVEKICLLIAIIRAGLLLDVSRIKGRFMFIILFSICPIAVEFILVMIVGHFLLGLPWIWSALLGSIISIVSLACVTSVMEKSREKGLGEEKHFSTVVIAASSINVIVSMMSYIICMYLGEGTYGAPFLFTFLHLIFQIVLGVTIGVVVGFCCAFLPDRRNSSAGLLRIVVIGLGTFSFASYLNENYWPASALFSVIIMCVVAGNMWEELGWHDVSNPVRYFYTALYYLCQPAVLSLVGFTMNFHNSTAKELGLSFAVLLIGLTGRQVTCVLVTLSHLYPTTKKEKIFLCIAWTSKGTFQALLSYGAGVMISENSHLFEEKQVQIWTYYTKIVKQTTILGIILVTPFTSYALTMLAPRLLSKSEDLKDENKKGDAEQDTLHLAGPNQEGSTKDSTRLKSDTKLLQQPTSSEKHNV